MMRAVMVLLVIVLWGRARQVVQATTVELVHRLP
jgi:hypothetical protein